MSSFKNAAKSRQRTHRERSQISGREHVGFLEKKKDYKLRARDHESKQRTLRLLKKRALNRNPDEFYFHMINSQVQDGEHREKESPDEVTESQLKLMQTQDLRYINYKRMLEAKKIDGLKSTLHLLEAEGKPENRHTLFVETKKEARSLDVAQRLDTLPSLLHRTFNRPTASNLERWQITGNTDDDTLQAIELKRKRAYKELSRRIEREKELFILARKMEVKRYLQNKKEAKPKREIPGSSTTAPIYKWRKERKR